MKATIMRAANTVIEGLLYGVCDPDFTDSVIDHVAGDIPFEAEDIKISRYQDIKRAEKEEEFYT